MRDARGEARRGISMATVAACVIVTGGCGFVSGMGDPGPSSPDVGLAMTADHHLMLLVNVCEPLVSVEPGEGTDSWAKADAVIVPSEKVDGGLQIDLSSLAAPYELTADSTPLAELAVPFFVRVRVPGGVWATQDFEALPDAGQVVYLSADSTTDKNEIGDRSAFPDGRPDCESLLHSATS